MSDEPLLSRPFVLCALANLLQGIAFSLFLHFPGFLKDLGAAETEIGWIFAATALFAIGFRPAVGHVMDTRGRRGVILLGNALNVLVVGLYLAVTGIGPLVYAVRILHGLSEAMLFTSLFTYAADHVPEKRLTEGLALFGVSGMLPISLGGLLGDWILGWGDYADVFRCSLGFAVAALVLSLPLRDAPGHGRAEEGVEAPRGFMAALTQRDLMPLWVIATAFSVALAAMFTFLKTYVMETGTGTVGGFFSAYTAIAIVLRVFLGWLPDRIGPKRVLFPALGVLATGFLLLAQASTGLEVQVAGVLCGIGHGFTFPILFGLVVSRARPAERGSAMAIYTGLFDVGLLVGGPLLGWVIVAAGYGAMFGAAAVVVVVSALVFAIWDRR